MFHRERNDFNERESFITAGRAADSVIGALRPAFTAQEEGSVADLTPLDRLLSPWKESHLDLLRAKGEIALCAVCSAIENKRYSMEAAGVAASIIVELSRLLDRKYTESSVVLLNTVAKIVTDTKEKPLSASVSAEWFNSLAHMYSSVKLYRKALKMLQRAIYIFGRPDRSASENPVLYGLILP